MLLLIFIVVLVIILFCFMDADLTLLFHHLFSAKKDYQNQVVWITGASSGIGEHLAYTFAENNAKLALSGVNLERLNNVKEICIALYKCKEEDILLVPFSIDNFDEHESNVKKVLDHFGQIDILVNNAGVSQRAQFEEIDIDVDQKLFNVNVFGTVNLTRKVLKHFLERGRGHVVAMSSLAGRIGAPFSSAYTGSKHALHGYFECLRTEMCQKNIDVTLVCPGPVFSRLTDRCVTSKLGEVYDHTQQPTDRKMKTERCSRLTFTAISNKLDECWISQQPLLTLFYCSQYIPSIYRTLFLKKFFNEKVASKLRQGR
ncbi:dehydrogenase/reductase SDR family member 7-like [Uloborus diversus]|uniref:dehydrogenase/reductase SDR family member 7-like n=1 Tax=Uloborus diversus TaxID=327109 RepID=UPI0024099FEB|nr:dehydrogenase/reductase SDR family member 7-like [Uloborus diversus]